MLNSGSMQRIANPLELSMIPFMQQKIYYGIGL